MAVEAYKWLPTSSMHPKTNRENTVRNMVEITRHNQTTTIVVLREYGRVSSSSMKKSDRPHLAHCKLQSEDRGSNNARRTTNDVL